MLKPPNVLEQHYYNFADLIQPMNEMQSKTRI